MAEPKKPETNEPSFDQGAELEMSGTVEESLKAAEGFTHAEPKPPGEAFSGDIRESTGRHATEDWKSLKKDEPQ